MDIDLHTAYALWPDAHAWYTGQIKYLPEDHVIRHLAQATFQAAQITHLNFVCNEVFRVIAEDAMKGRT